MKRLLLIFLLLFCARVTEAQITSSFTLGVRQRGTTLPASCTDTRRLFMLTQTDGANAPGLYRCNGTAYAAVSSPYTGGEVTNPVLGPNGTAGAPTFSFSSDTNTGMFRSGADALGFSTGGIERWLINSSGAFNPLIDNTYDIGNGTVNPRDVNVSRKLVLGKAATNTGQIDFAGTTSGVVSMKPADAAGTWTLTLPTNDGDSGQALTTNGSGVASWTTIAATPGGADTNVQYNDGGVFGGEAAFTYNKTTNTLSADIVDVGAGHPNGLQYDANTLIYGSGGTATFYLTSANEMRVDGVTGVKIRSDRLFAWTSGTDATQSVDTGVARNAAGVVEVNNGTAGTIRDLVFRNFRGSGTAAAQLSTAQTTAPTCTSNCGTSPSVVGTDTFMRVTMGATGSPASGWVVTFNGTWAAAPVCTVQMAKAGMVVGKQALTVVTTTTTLTVVTNGTAPSTTDQYAISCGGVQ